MYNTYCRQCQYNIVDEEMTDIKDDYKEDKGEEGNDNGDIEILEAQF